MLPSLLDEVSWRRRRSRIVTWTAGVAAGAVLAIGVLFAVPDIRAHPAAGERGGSADGAGRDEQAGLDGLPQRRAAGNVHLDERYPLPAAEEDVEASLFVPTCAIG